MWTIDVPDSNAILVEPDNSAKEAHEARARVARQQRLGLYPTADPKFDDLARQVADAFGVAYAMVNLVGIEEQFFTGLWAPPTEAEVTDEIITTPAMGRTMNRDEGYCPHVIKRRKTLVLGDVCAYPRFATNPVVDKFKVRAYLGVPLFDRGENILGTLCGVDIEQHRWTMKHVDRLYEFAAIATDLAYAHGVVQR